MDPICMDPIYLDHNATTPVLPEVLKAMLPYLGEHFGNPSSGHVYGRRAAEAIARARAQVAGLIGALPEEIVFTGGGTEASNLAIRGVRGAGAVVTSVIEHPATAAPCRFLETQGRQVRWCGVDRHGIARLSELAGALGAGAALLTLMHANNETGSLQPVAAAAALAREVGALVHTDAAQSAGKIPVGVDALGVDLLSLAGHKLYAPKGVGALYVRRGTRLSPLVLGAGHEGGLRPGTENVPHIVGLGVACELAARDLETVAGRMGRLTERLWARLRDQIPGVELNGHPTDRLPNTLNVRLPGASGNAVLAGALGVAASTGSACHEGGERPSSVLVAMGIPEREALGALRLSLGRHTTEAAVDRAAEAIIGAWRAVRG